MTDRDATRTGVATQTGPFAVPTRILLVEDSDVDAHLLEMVLRRSSFTVERVSRLSAAATILRSSAFDLILSDLGLPDSSGLETVDALLEQAGGIPIVVVTGRDDEATALRAVAAGAQDYLVKGNMDPNALVRAVRYAVERGRGTEGIIRSEARLRAILEGALDAVVGVRIDGRITLWNRSAEEIFGWPRAAVLGCRVHEVLVPERYRSKYEQELERFRDTGRLPMLGCRVEWLALRRDGTECPVEVRITAEADQEGATFTVFLSDITERRRADEDRRAAEARFHARQRQMEQQIEQASRVASLGRVSASVAHEFNNLLMGMAPFAEVLAQRSRADESLSKLARHILNAVRRGQRLTDEILRFTSPPEPRLGTVALASWLPLICEEARGIAGARTLETEIAEALQIRADSDQLAQVLLNLVTNARDATTPGGTVTLGAARAEDVPFLRARLPAGERLLTLFVRDDGSGIPPHVVDRIFEPLFTTKKEGHGIGLAVAWQIVAQHGGQILIETECGVGSTFHLVLPFQ
jgi:two-component system, cell cycle sensor histidine kinase and response regulator CckA